MRQILAIAAWFSISFSSYCQSFDPVVYQENQALIDSFYSTESYPELDKVLERQVNYLLKHSVYDSLPRYVYKTGRAKAQLGQTEAATDRAEYLVGLIQKEVEDSSDILFAINELSWVYYEAGLDSMCLVTDLRYLNFCESYENADASERSDAHYNLGFDYQASGETPKAIKHFRKALEIIEKNTSASNLTKRVDTYNALGATYWKYGDMNKAKKALKTSSDLSLQMDDTVMSKLFASNAIGNLSLAYEDEGNLAKSMELLEEAIALRKAALPYIQETYDRDIQRKHLIANYHNLAALYLSIGDLDRSLAMTEYVYAQQEEYFPANRGKIAGYEESLGSIKLAAGNYKEAEQHLLSSLEATVEEFGEVNYHTLNRHQRLGQLYQEWGKHKKALAHINRTIEIANQVSDILGSQELAKAYRDRAAVKVALADYSGAHDDLKKAVSIFYETFGNDGNPIGEIQLARSRVFLAENKSDSAEYYLDEALRIFQLNRSRNLDEESGNYSGIVRLLPEALLMKSRFVNKGDEASMKEALNHLENSLSYLREERRNFDSDGSQLSFIDGHASIYSESAGLAHKLFKLTGNETYRDEVFRFAEERKTVLLKRQLNKFSSLRVALVPDSIIAKERSLLKELSDPQSKEDYGELQKEYDDLLDYIQDKYPTYYELRYDSKTASLKDVQDRLLVKRQTLVEYVQTESELLAFVITPSNIELVPLDETDLQKRIFEFNQSLIGRNQSLALKLGSDLFQSIMAPLIPYFSGSEVFIIPDGPLYALNFEVLTDDRSDAYLIENYTISYLLSATTSLLYRNLSSHNKDDEGILALAPGFENNENTSGSGQKFIRQPFAMRTAEFIGDLFSGKSLLAAQATEERFKKEAGKHRIIHLGTHTEVNTKSPMLSRLILAKSEVEDGYLHAYEIYNLPLRAELAVLTACETGVGKASQSEGVLSMAHGFAYAGCPSLVMSLWEIDEKTSAQIIETFYEYLADGMPKNKALRLAKMQYLRKAKGELKNPYYWSGLVLFGNATPVEYSSDYWWIALSLIGVLFLLLFARRVRKKSE